MTIENLKQIAIKYATTKGSRVPLAPDELCNAVVQYMNSFFGVMTDINTIKVAVTEDSGNIVFTITGNTYDGKPITPIVITVDHNDFVTDQEFEEFKTTTNAAIQKNTESINSLSFRVEDTENDITTIQVQVGQINTRVGKTETDVTNLKNRVDNTETNIAEINSTLNNKLDKITSVSNSNQVYGKSAAGENLMYNLESHPNAGYVLQYDSDGNIYVNKGSSEYTPANMQNISDVEAKIPSTDNFLLKNVTNIINYAKFKIIDEIGSNIIGKADTNNNMSIGSSNYAMQLNSSIRPIIYTPDATYNVAYTSDIPEYTNVDSVSYDSTNGAIVAYDGANEIHIPLLAGENVTIDASEDNKKIVISAAGGGGTGDVTAAGNNTFTGENTFTNEITFNTMKSEAGYIQFGNFNYETTEGYDYLYIDNTHINIQKFVGNNQYHEININADLMTYAPPDDTVYYEYSYPRKNGTFALTSDIIKNPIYFISFCANAPSEPCHLIGTMMSKNSYGTGQKTNEEFAVMLSDNLYTNSNEGLAAYGKLAKKDILCIYSEDGLSIRCLDEENSEVDLPTVMFFVMETEL